MTPIEESVARGDSADTTQKIIDEQADMQRLSLVTKARRLYELREQCDLWEDVMNMTDSFSFDREDGVVAGPRMAFYSMAQAYGNALVRPSATSCAYINWQQLRIIRAYSRAFCLVNPYWWAVQRSRASYTVGCGHTYSVAPKNPKNPVDDTVLSDVQEVIDELCEANNWSEYQREKLRRGDRDGEFFLRYYRDNEVEGNRVLQVRFVEPLLVCDPPGIGPEQEVWFGVQFKRGDYQNAQGYYVRNTNYLGSDNNDDAWRRMIAKSEIQHRKYNVDLDSPRGIPLTYPVAPRLEQALKTLGAMGKLVHYREKIALIRKHINATISTVQAYLGAKTNRTSPIDSIYNVEQLPDSAILDTNDSTQYEFPSQHVDTDKIVFAVKAELQAVAAATGLADFMVSADSGGSNFASSMVSEGPAVKSFSELQADMIRDDQEVFREAMRMAIEDGRLPADTIKKVKILANAPKLVERNRIQDTQADDLLLKDGAMSRKTMRLRAELDPEAEEEQVQKEQKQDDERAEKQMKAQIANAPAPTNGTGKRTQASRQKVTARPFSADQEPGPSNNPQKG